MLNKKAQAILPFFALQLVAIMIFFIVLLTLLGMAQNVNFVVNEFNEETAFLLASRRMFSSADCLAYEKQDSVYDPVQNQVIHGSRIFPGVVDKNKLLDYEYFNCMRKDKYDRIIDVKEGIWDAEQGGGAVFRYSLAAYDLTEENNVPLGHVFQFDHDGNGFVEFKEHFIHSLVGRVRKDEEGCNFESTSDVCLDYGGGWDCRNWACKDIDLKWDWVPIDAEDYAKDQGCRVGRCQVKGEIEEGDDMFRPYWVLHESTEELYPEDEEIQYTFMPLDGSWEQYRDPEDKDHDVDAVGDVWHQYDDSCFGDNTTKRGIFPVMMRVDNSYHPTYIFFESCVKEGTEHIGINTLEITYKLEPGKECVE